MSGWLAGGRPSDRQTDRLTDRQTVEHTDQQAGRQTLTQKINIWLKKLKKQRRDVINLALI